MSEKSLEALNSLDLLIDPANIRHDSNYKLIDGTVLSFAELSAVDIAYLVGLARKAIDGMGYLQLLRFTRGLGAYPLNGSIVITEQIAASVLFRTAEDIVVRAATQQGVLIPPQQAVDMSGNLLTVPTVADILGITRAAVNQMLRSARLNGTRYGRTFLIKEDDLERFRAHWPGPRGRPKRKGSGGAKL